jgi:hypothetical protein
MTTLAELLDQLRNLIGDTGAAPHFNDLQLTDFLNRAIQELNPYFPRRLSYTLSAVAGEHEYALETNCRAVLACEFPAGRTPPVFLRRMDCTDPDFWRRGDRYDLILPHDASSLNPPRLILSTAPAGGEGIALQIEADHNLLSAPGDEVTLPGRYHPLLLLCARLQVWRELSTAEGMDPNPIQLWSATLELNVERAERQYRSALKAALAAESRSAAAAWRMPPCDRVY